VIPLWAHGRVTCSYRVSETRNSNLLRITWVVSERVATCSEVRDTQQSRCSYQVLQSYTLRVVDVCSTW